MPPPCLQKHQWHLRTFLSVPRSWVGSLLTHFFLPQICNDSAVELTRNCTVFHDFTNSIGGKCCTKDYHKSKGISGRQWSDQDFNVVVAYGNCNHGIDSDEPAPGPKNDPWGPNGLCEDD